jgi:hypothetical protein
MLFLSLWLEHNLHYLFLFVKVCIAFGSIVQFHGVTYDLGGVDSLCLDKVKQLFAVFFHRALAHMD